MLAQIDLTEIFHFSVSPFELMLRGTIMYWFLFLIFRFILRRDIGSVGVTDFLFVVILGDAAQNAMIGEATSASDGIILIATLVFWNYLFDVLSYFCPWFERFTSARRLMLVDNGKILRRNMRKEYITMEELEAKIHQEGLENFFQVKSMHVEPDGEISVVKVKSD